MKAKTTLRYSYYFPSKEHGINLDVSQYSFDDFVGKFDPLYKEIKKVFRVAGDDCDRYAHKIYLVAPKNCYKNTRRNGHEIVTSVTPEGLQYHSNLFEFLKPYGFTQLLFLGAEGEYEIMGVGPEIPDKPKLIPSYISPEAKLVILKDHGSHWDATVYRSGETRPFAVNGCWYKCNLSFGDVMGWLSATYPNAKIEKTTAKNVVPNW